MAGTLTHQDPGRRRSRLARVLLAAGIVAGGTAVALVQTDVNAWAVTTSTVNFGNQVAGTTSAPMTLSLIHI